MSKLLSESYLTLWSHKAKAVKCQVENVCWKSSRLQAGVRLRGPCLQTMILDVLCFSMYDFIMFPVLYHMLYLWKLCYDMHVLIYFIFLRSEFIWKSGMDKAWLITKCKRLRLLSPLRFGLFQWVCKGNWEVYESLWKANDLEKAKDKMEIN